MKRYIGTILAAVTGAYITGCGAAKQEMRYEPAARQISSQEMAKMDNQLDVLASQYVELDRLQNELESAEKQIESVKR